MIDAINDNNLEATKAVGNKFKDEVKRAKGILPAAKVEPIDAEQYREACFYLGDDILSSEHLVRMARWLALNRNKLKQMFPDGGKCCLAVMPTSDMGIPLSQNEVKQNRYFYTLFVSGKDGLTHEFSMTPAHFYELLPPEMQKECSFAVKYSDDNAFLNDEDYKGFHESFVKAFHNLRKFFGLKPIKKE